MTYEYTPHNLEPWLGLIQMDDSFALDRCVECGGLIPEYSDIKASSNQSLLNSTSILSPTVMGTRLCNRIGVPQSRIKNSASDDSFLSFQEAPPLPIRVSTKRVSFHLDAPTTDHQKLDQYPSSRQISENQHIEDSYSDESSDFRSPEAPNYTKPSAFDTSPVNITSISESGPLNLSGDSHTWSPDVQASRLCPHNPEPSLYYCCNQVHEPLPQGSIPYSESICINSKSCPYADQRGFRAWVRRKTPKIPHVHLGARTRVRDRVHTIKDRIRPRP